jgi:hypothetical protein
MFGAATNSGAWRGWLWRGTKRARNPSNSPTSFYGGISSSLIVASPSLAGIRVRVYNFVGIWCRISVCRGIANKWRGIQHYHDFRRQTFGLRHHFVQLPHQDRQVLFAHFGDLPEFGDCSVKPLLCPFGGALRYLEFNFEFVLS